MMKKIAVITSVLASAMIAGGCATYSGWQPTVDPYGDKNPQMIQADTEQCQMLAKQAGSLGTESLKGAGVGALIGAAGGAALGAIWGNPATGAAAGATIGGIGGGANQGIDADSQYKRAFINCMRNRGHNVVN
jgi:outer membrane lipoprotein SlyB